MLEMTSAVQKSVGIQSAWQAIERATSHEDAMLRPWEQWHSATSVMTGKRVMDIMLRDFPVAAGPVLEGRHREARKAMQPSAEEKWLVVESVLLRRMRRWVAPQGPVVAALRLLAQSRPRPDLATALIRTVCFTLATTARFHNVVVFCHFL